MSFACCWWSRDNSDQRFINKELAEHDKAQFATIRCTLVLTLESLLSSDMLDEDSGLPGEEESTCKGPSFSTLISDGVCKGTPWEQGRKDENLSDRLKEQYVFYWRWALTLILTECFVLCSSSCALQNSCSKELASSLNNPTSSQFFRKRVGVGVWSAKNTFKMIWINHFPFFNS